MLRRVVGLLLVVLVVFFWGVTSGQHRLFPWTYVEPVQQRITGLLRMFGVVPWSEELRRKAPAFTVNSGLLNFDGLILNSAAPIQGYAGGLATYPGGLLIARAGDGSIWRYSKAEDGLTTLPYRLPSTNAAAVPERTPSGRSIRPDDLRYHDLEIVGDQLLVSYNFYDAARNCFVLRLDAADLPDGWAAAGEPGSVALAWRTVFETHPCLPFADDRNTFAGNQAGGRIVADGAGAVYLSTGDFEFDGLDSKQPALPQVDDSSYGRVLHIGLADGKVTEISRGHRNAQAMTLDAGGRLWLAEHGPMGGDELNLIQPGGNYGWPNVTLGRFYQPFESDNRFWPALPAPAGAIGPQYAWMPSIAPSAMLAIDGIPAWQGDLLVVTLAGQGLHRLRLEGDRVLYDEPIPLGRRIRDLALADGRIYLLFDDGLLGYLAPHQMLTEGTLPSVGRALYDNNCVSCHSNPAAPRLAGVFGADIAAQPGVAYSAALTKLEGAWTREALGRFLAAPDQVAPGTSMPNPGLTPETITAVLDELEHLKR